jgi:hypothetical protein
MKVTVTFSRQEVHDDSPDLSYLEDTDASTAEYHERNAERLKAYYRGDWHMIGIRAKAIIWIERKGYRTNYELESPGLWGIEYDSSEEYLREVFEQECDQLRQDIEAIRSAAIEYKL